MLKIGIITGSTRKGRVNPQVAEWIKKLGDRREDAEYKVIDIKDFDLPIFEEAVPAIFSEGHEKSIVQKWAAAIDELDGFIFVTPEYNRGVTASLKSAIDYLFKEWNNKAAGIVSYGSSGGAIAAQQLRLILTVPKVATVGTQPALNLFTDFKEMTEFAPADFHEETIDTMLDEVLSWSKALKTIR